MSRPSDVDKLFDAVNAGLLSVVKALLLEEDGVDINSKNKDGETPLMTASSRGDLDMVQFLCDQKIYRLPQPK